MSGLEAINGMPHSGCSDWSRSLFLNSSPEPFGTTCSSSDIFVLYDINININNNRDDSFEYINFRDCSMWKSRSRSRATWAAARARTGAPVFLPANKANANHAITQTPIFATALCAPLDLALALLPLFVTCRKTTCSSLGKSCA